MSITKIDQFQFAGKAYSTHLKASRAWLHAIHEQSMAALPQLNDEQRVLFIAAVGQLVSAVQNEISKASAKPDSLEGTHAPAPEGTRDTPIWRAHTCGPGRLPKWQEHLWTAVEFRRVGGFSERVSKFVCSRPNCDAKHLIPFVVTRCAHDEHDWMTDPKNSLIDYCLRCGEGRA